MQRIRIARKAPKRKRPPETLPLDPRDPDVVRAKWLEERPRPGRRAA
jgi:hypothetical protein